MIVALTNDTLVDSACDINLEICRQRIDDMVVKQKIIRMYKEAFKLGKLIKPSRIGLS
jgi:hypothetical protein